MDINGQAAIVTGAGSGIGRAIAHRFAASGANILVVDVDEKAAQAVAAEITSDGGSSTAYACDVSQHDRVKSTFTRLLESVRVHVLVNNAGISHVGNLETTTEQDFEKLYSVNVKGMYNCMQAFIGHMKANGGGVILNMASIAATSGVADRFAYSMTKGAVVAMTYSVARDYVGHNIRCNCISPARVHTPFVDGFLRSNYPGREEEMFKKLEQSAPIGRMARPEEVASLALYLCSDEASFVTGCDYPIDGGFFTIRG